MLEARGLRSGYRGSMVVDGIDLDVGEGGLVAILGRNGVGKTTLISTIMGLVRPYSGSVRLAGRELAGARPDAIARAGVGLVPQGRRVFAPLSVEENLRIAVRRGRAGRWTVERVYELLPQLAERRSHRGDQLSGGEQQMLAIGRALLGNPRLLLLDEPSDGLAPAAVRGVEQVITGLRAEGLAVLLVEQNLRVAFALADEIVVMQKGRIVHRSGTTEFRRSPDIARRFLGVA
ncbi:MAG: ATP-binding cassette domain-containing protein [Streptosporangiales bacterium]|nr:ATP-binding cassette domain-containing protein [Streptosporangiales bacterium]